jgi:phage terminase small subunit
LALRSDHPRTSRSVGRKRRAKTPIEPEIPAATQDDRDEIAERAGRLGVTPERVLQEYARIAFADLRRFADWGPGGLVLKTPGALSDADAAAISEITTSGAGSGNYRVKLYDKKAALDAIARHLGMFVRPPKSQDGGTPADLAEDAREVLARRLARFAAGGAEK